MSLGTETKFQIFGHKIFKIEKKDFKKNFLLKRLLEIPDCPNEIFYAGSFPEKGTKILSVVGSRAITSYGKTALEFLFKEMQTSELAVVSGLALGTDALAHSESLKNNLFSICVPGSGISEKAIYPKTNKDYARKILESGGLILNEFPPDFLATPWSFPARNRIMAAISDAVFIVEASQKSGTLITARLAMEYNKDVLCLPGQIFSTNSYGPNWLISQGAKIINSTSDILDELKIKIEKVNEKKILNLSPDEKKVYEALDSPKNKDELNKLCKLEITDFLMALTLLEMKNLIKEVGGEIYRI